MTSFSMKERTVSRIWRSSSPREKSIIGGLSFPASLGKAQTAQHLADFRLYF
jgi:hypothetical protein